MLLPHTTKSFISSPLVARCSQPSASIHAVFVTLLPPFLRNTLIPHQNRWLARCGAKRPLYHYRPCSFAAPPCCPKLDSLSSATEPLDLSFDTGSCCLCECFSPVYKPEPHSDLRAVAVIKTRESIKASQEL